MAENVEKVELTAEEKKAQFQNETVDKSVEAMETKMEGLATKEEVSGAVDSIAEKINNRLDEMETNYKSIGVNTTPKAKNHVEEQLRENEDKFKALASGNKDVRIKLDLSSMVNKTFTASAGADSAPYLEERVSTIHYDPNYQNRVRNYLMVGRTGNDGAIRHNYESDETDSAGSKAKGVAQTQSAVTVTDVHTPIQTLYNLLTLPKEHFNDIQMIDSYLSTRLMKNLMDVEDQNILRGDPGTGAAGSLTAATAFEGINNNGVAFADSNAITTYVGSSIAGLFDSTDASNFYDVLRAAKAGLANNNYVASVTFMNPLDVAVLDLTKSTQGEYIIHQTFDSMGNIQKFWNGIQIVETPAQSAGTFTMLDKSATQYWIREDASVEFGLNDNDFATNSISVRCSIRGAVTNYLANGIVSDTFSDWQTALDA